MYNYFPHSSAMRTADVVLTLRMAEGPAGYGVYCMLLELLRDAEDRKLVLNPRNLAFALNVPDVDLVDRVLHSPGLFTLSEDGFFTSPWLEMVMGEFDAKKEAAREAGRRGAAARYAQKQPHGDPMGGYMANPSQPDGNTPTEPNENKEINPSSHSRTKVYDLRWKEKDGEFFFRLARGARTDLTDMDYETCLAQKDAGEKHAPGMYDPMFVYEFCKVLGLSSEMLAFLLELTACGSKKSAATRRMREIFAAWTSRDKSKQFRPTYPSDYVLTQLVPLA